MIDDSERREVARRLRELKNPYWHGSGSSEAYMDVMGVETYLRRNGFYYDLADLIEPTDGFDLDTVQRVCFECMEGCDEPEWTLYTTIHDAIARYKRGESGPTCDRDELLELADEFERDADEAMDYYVRSSESAAAGESVAYRDCARRVREASGVEHAES